MVRIDVLKDRLQQMNKSLTKISKYQNLSYEEYLGHEVAEDVVEYNLFIAINMMIDIATHIVVDNQIGTPGNFRETFELLEKEKLLNHVEKDLYVNMIGFRNILSHEYIKLNKKIVYNIMQKNLNDFKKFILFINEEFL